MTCQRLILVLLVAWLVGCERDARRDQPKTPAATRSPENGAQASPPTQRCPHALPLELCTKCNPALAPVFQAKGDWCEEHGFPESFCPICNPHAVVPDVGETPEHSRDWCGEHGLPESMCTKCNPSLVEKFKDSGDWCATHNFPESACPVCNPQEPPTGAEEAAIEARVVRFKAPDIESAAGLQTVAAQKADAAAGVECTARIAFDSDRVADIRAIVPGIVRRVYASLGAAVSRGERLFELESTRVGEIQGALQSAREEVRTAQANLDRQRDLRQRDIASARQVEVAEQELARAQAQTRTAEATLRMAGASQSTPSGRYVLSAPIAGTVVRRPAVMGVLATESQSLATIADTSVMWALCDVSEADAPRVALQQRVVVTVEGATASPIAGTITWVAAEVDPRTRTVTARAELNNTEGHLRANQFARARIETGATLSAVTVPRDAVQRVGEHEVVFVRAKPGMYQPRVVKRTGGGQAVQVTGRISAGEEVVTIGAVLLRTEIMPGSIGAGCCEVEPLGDN